MGTIGTFDAFTTSRLGIYAAMQGLQVTGNNISNISTTGYTRQRLDQVSLKTGGNDMYRSIYDNHVGNGALVTSINQIRDPYLDIRYRNTAADVGYNDTMLAGLQEIADTLDEVGKGITIDSKDGILYAQLQDIYKSLQQLSNNPTKENDTLVRESANTLTTLFHTYAEKLETLRQNTEASFKEEVQSVNDILTNIRNLNEKIRASELCGDNALEMRDERNRQIDALSEYMLIKVEYTMEDVGAGKQVEKLTISLGDANPDPLSKTDSTILVDGIYGSQFSIKQLPVQNPDVDPDDPNVDPDTLYLDQDGNPCGLKDAAKVDSPNYDLVISKLVDSKNIVPPNYGLEDMNTGRPVELQDNDIYGSLQAMRELLTEKGEFSTNADVAIDPNAATKRGIPYYQLSLDLLARKFAETYNALNQGAKVDENGNVIYAEQTGTPEDLGLTLLTTDDPGVAGYYVDANGYYAGIHGGTCYMKDAGLNVNDSLETAVAKLAKVADEVGIDMTQFVDADGKITDEDAAQAALEAFIGQHGVKESDLTNGEFVNPIYTSVSPEGTGPLFSNRNDGDDTSNITASNIAISHSWSTGDVKIVPTYVYLYDGTVANSTQNENVDHMIAKISESLIYNPQDLVGPDGVSTKLFNGSFNDMFSNMATVLGEDQRVTNVQLNTHYTSLVEIDSNRDGVSGVDLNDEAMNMMQFQKAYSAACRLMTAIDQALDRLINNTGVAGL